MVHSYSTKVGKGPIASVLNAARGAESSLGRLTVLRFLLVVGALFLVPAWALVIMTSVSKVIILLVTGGTIIGVAPMFFAVNMKIRSARRSFKSKRRTLEKFVDAVDSFGIPLPEINEQGVRNKLVGIEMRMLERFNKSGKITLESSEFKEQMKDSENLALLFELSATFGLNFNRHEIQEEARRRLA